MDLIAESMVPAMDEVGRLFEAEEYFVPELLLAGRAMKSALELLRPLLAASGQRTGGPGRHRHRQGRPARHRQEHRRAPCLKAADLKSSISAPTSRRRSFVAAVEERKPHVVCMSALLTVTMPAMKTTIDALEAAGLRTQVKVLIGGAPVTMPVCQGNWR